MLMCKQSEGSGLEDPFVRLVSGAPEPMTVLSFDWLLQDIDRFCCGEEHTILSVDPTFNLGDFDVTVTTYRNLMLVNSDGNHPVMVGPIFIHQRKKFETYYFFASSLVGLNPNVRHLKAFGTDGEMALSNAFHTVFNKAVHIRCFLHFKGNLDSKLQELSIPKHERIEFLRDVFGNPLELEYGLIDADDDKFEASLKSLEHVWKEREKVYHDPPQFYDWFLKNSKDPIKKTMLKSRRIQAGLGNPPEPFYTNDVESQNNVIKHQSKYRSQELPQFINSMRDMIVCQRKEIERAVIGIGEYRLSSRFQHLLTRQNLF